MSTQPRTVRPRSRRRHTLLPHSISPSSVAGKLRLVFLAIVAMAALNLGASRWTASVLGERTADIRSAFEEQLLFWEVYHRIRDTRRAVFAASSGSQPVDANLDTLRVEAGAVHAQLSEGLHGSLPTTAAAGTVIQETADSLFRDWGLYLSARSADERAAIAVQSANLDSQLLGTLLPEVLDAAGQRLRRAQDAFAAASDWGNRLSWLVVIASAALGGLILLTLGRLGPRLRRFERAAIRIGRGDLDARVPIDSEDELADVARAFNAMATELDATITNHHGAVVALQQSESRFRQLFENASDALFLHDLGGRHSDVNRQACEMLGYSRHELLEMPVVAMVKEGARERLETIWTRLEPGEVTSLELELVRKDGTEVPVDVRITLLELGGQKVVRVAARDLTERRELEERLVGTSKLEAVGRLAGGIAHDFNNVLTSIRGHCELALEDLDSANPLGGDLREIDKSAERAASLVQQLLAFSRQQMLTPTAVSPVEVVRGMELMLKRVIDESIVLTVVAEEDVGLVHVDPGQLERVILNLVINARDAMPGGGGLRIRLRNERLTHTIVGVSEEIEPGDYVCLSVADSGEGIPPDVLPNIFEPFFTTKPVGRGSGLGLSTVYGIVKQSRGSVDVRSRLGRGTRIDIRLPRVRGAPECVEEDDHDGAADRTLEDEPFAPDAVR